MDNLFLLVNYLSRRNIFAPCKNTPIGIGNNNHFNRPLYSQHAQILHPCLEVITIIYVQYIYYNVCSRNEEKQSIQRHPIIATDADYDYIMDEIEPREKNYLERNVSINSDE